MVGLVKKLEQEAFAAGITLRSQESMTWFRRRSHNIRRVDRNSLMKENDMPLRNTTAVGRIYHYFYDPKHKETLPFYDSFPLAIIVGPAAGGFLGLNLHYLPPLLRAHFLDSLMDITTNNKFNENTKFKLSYQLLKSSTKYKEFKPCLKHYLSTHVRSKFALVPAEDWEKVLFLPSASFEKSSNRNVYKDSVRLLRA